jgi:thiamine biosynthesis lipoprotein
VGISFYNKKTNVKKTVYAFDTVIEMSAEGKNADEAIKKSVDLIKKYDDEISVFKKTSDVYLLNQSKNFKVSEDVFKLISNSLVYSEKTNGYFDITIKPVMELWNIQNGGYVPTEDELKNTLEKVGYKSIIINGENIILKNNASIDLGGIAKGYCANKINDIMKEYGVKQAIINMGGNIYVLGGRTFEIGLQCPDGVRGEHFGICTVKNTSVVTSGAYERYFEKDGKKYHHIINPYTGKCADTGLESVTIIGENSEKCDAYSTAVYILGKDEGIKLLNKESDLEYVIADENKNVYISENIKFRQTDERYKIHKVN